mgnify:CR=1 FL=1
MLIETILFSALIAAAIIISQPIFNQRAKTYKPKLKTLAPYDNNSETNQLISIEFINRSSEQRKFWIEPYCVEFEPDANWEFKLISNERSYQLDFDSDATVIWMGDFQLFKRPTSEATPNPNLWELEIDYLSID